MKLIIKTSPVIYIFTIMIALLSDVGIQHAAYSLTAKEIIYGVAFLMGIPAILGYYAGKVAT